MKSGIHEESFRKALLLSQMIPFRSKYGLSRPSGTDTTMTSLSRSTATFSVVGETGLRTFWLAALLISWFMRKISEEPKPVISPQSATPMYIRPPSEFENATISAASESALVTSDLNWRRLSSPREICFFSSVRVIRILPSNIIRRYAAAKRFACFAAPGFSK